MAYSPAITADGTVTKNSSTVLNVTLKGNETADVLYTVPTGAKSKIDKTVDLGLFNHALAKVKVIVKAVYKNNNDEYVDLTENVPFSVAELGIKTIQTSGTLNLTDPGNGIINGDAETEQAFTLFTNGGDNNNSHLLNSPLEKECYMLPSTEENSSVTVALKDEKSANPDKYDINISKFEKSKSDNIEFIAGKTTVLTIKVKVTTTGTEPGTDDIILEGNLTDWKCNGRFDVTIE